MTRRILHRRPAVIPPPEIRGRVDKVAQILAAAARDGWDVSAVLAAACRMAARDLDGIHDEDGRVWDGEAALVEGAGDGPHAERVRQLADGWRTPISWRA